MFYARISIKTKIDRTDTILWSETEDTDTQILSRSTDPHIMNAVIFYGNDARISIKTKADHTDIAL